MRFILFNPENDLALASFSPRYTPPASALQFAHDLAPLPRLWAEADDVVLPAPLTADARPLVAAALARAKVEGRTVEVSPWGWSPLVRRQLADVGVPEQLLPTATEMAHYRHVASRHTAVRLLKALRQEWRDERVVGQSEWCLTMQEVEQAHRLYGRSMLKAPISGSGRGVHPVAETAMPERTRLWAERCLRVQGAVECEPLYERVADLAVEFWHRGSAKVGSSIAASEGREEARLAYVGLSLFATTAGGVYAGNVVATEAQKEAAVASFLPEGMLHEAIVRLQRLLTAEADIPRWYVGPVGVDMMVVRKGSQLCLHPLVEINLRYTMGYVALHIAQQTPAASMPSVWSISHDGGHYYEKLTPWSNVATPFHIPL